MKPFLFAYLRIRKNYRALDAFDQQYLVFQNIYRFRNIGGIDVLPSFDKGDKAKGQWAQAGEICEIVNSLSEEMVDADAMNRDDDLEICVYGSILQEYRDFLEEQNFIDFAAIQVEACKLLQDNPQILAKLQAQIEYIMIDEYQDTNYIQEQLIFMLAGDKQNICVVGDDDQGLYRFRGATIRNILEFPNKFPKDRCKIIPLNINYRSNSDIVSFYNQWMSTTSGRKFSFDWEHYRYVKTIIPHRGNMASPAVVQVAGIDDVNQWHENVLNFIKTARDSGKISNYNQIAFLFRSVKGEQATGLANFLEYNGINVYSPRSEMFFQRDEVKLLLGCLMLMFPGYVQKLEGGQFKYVFEDLKALFTSCSQQKRSSKTIYNPLFKAKLMSILS
ncbi:MAG: ATP-dependent helicase [Deferribacteraceae bacterium]|nr:ATP-dependent helicase [Deferribacteraceae bacterium]